MNRTSELALASNQGISVSEMLELARSSDSFTRKALAANPSITQEVVDVLASDYSIVVRIALAKNPAVNVATLINMAISDYEVEVRLAAVESELLDEESLISIIESIDKWPEFKSYATIEMEDKKYNKPIRQKILASGVLSRGSISQLMESCSVRTKRDIAACPTIDNYLLDVLCDDPEFLVREAVATNPSTNQIALDKLSHDSNYSIRLCVAKNTSSNAITLDRLIDDESYIVRRAVAKNPSLSMYTLMRIAPNYATNGLADELVSRRDLPGNLHAEIWQFIKDREIRAGRFRTTYYSDIVYQSHDDEINDPDSPLDGWHFDEDNGWLDFYPED